MVALAVEQCAPGAGAAFPGRRVDDAPTSYHRHRLEHGETPSLDQVHDAYRDHWTRALADERGVEPSVHDAPAIHRPASVRGSSRQAGRE